MSPESFAAELREWLAHVEQTATYLYDSGAHPVECINLAIMVVESRRKKRAAETAGARRMLTMDLARKQ